MNFYEEEGPLKIYWSNLKRKIDKNEDFFKKNRDEAYKNQFL